ncbi:xanthine dehydrogenase family protein subunit M [Rhodococcus sp. NCIMB 12038]|uniref:FAD binding domain-containing protein n=1 Tax=Rhodococcus sp. NCIMB 12038 TaxID=933800 RepID=UPI000B3C0637|nr:xanthine dehydrogenase family protein subunit M [Rhodococcus sp. NCIMB 12038]OUS94782.1 carbon monoxide dehydrogenase [Rhodococcus sp. NCIMB 12038]
MIPSSFDYVAPTSVDQAVAALAEAGEDAKILGGGQSLLPVLRLRLSSPSTLVDLGRIGELRGVHEDGDSIVIGAMTTYYDVIRNPLVHEHALLLVEASRTVADPQIRHRGTLGGALAHADPAGDLCGPALALDATLTVVGTGGRRTIAVADFFEGYYTTTMRPDEILVDVRIPKHTGWEARYEKFNTVAEAWSIVGVAATIQVDGGMIRQARVALTNMGSVPVRARGVEDALVGKAADPESIRAAAEHAAEGTDPVTDGNADAEYRTHLARVLTRRAVATAVGV